MSLTLDPILTAAQTAQSRHPLVEIISSRFVEDIPFSGQMLTSETLDESNSSIILHSSGRLALIYVFNGGLKYSYSDLERQVMNFVDLAVGGIHVDDAAICEMADKNIGILYRGHDAYDEENLYLFRIIIDETGTIISSAQVANYHPLTFLSGPAVIKIEDNSFLAVYSKFDGSDYGLYKRTSLDFITWSDESELSIGSLDLTGEISYPNLLLTHGGDIFLRFDAAEATENIFNIYYSISSDGGGTWGNAVKDTSYDSVSSWGKHPFAIEKIPGQMYVIFNEEKSALFMDSSQDGWGLESSSTTDVSFDAANRKIYALCTYTGIGIKSLYGVVEIDADTWLVTKFWNCLDSLPHFNTLFSGTNVWWESHHGEGYFIPVGTTRTTDVGTVVISVLNAQDNIITDYVFGDRIDAGLAQNVNHAITGKMLYGTWVDFNTLRLYVLFASHDVFPIRVTIGWIDLTEPGPLYHFNTVVDNQNLDDNGQIDQIGFAVYPGSDLILVWNQSPFVDSINYRSGMAIYSLSTGAQYKRYSWDEGYTDFPYWGITSAALVGDKIYATFAYHGGHGCGDKRGLLEINLLDDSMIYRRPTFAEVDEYGLNQVKPLPDGRLLIACYAGDDPTGYGILIYDPSLDTWKAFNDDTLPGMPPAGANNYFMAVYDAEEEMIYCGSAAGLTGFSEHGFIKRSSYFVGNLAGSWTFGASSPLVIGFQDYDATGCFGLDEEGLWAFWTNLHGSELSIKWDLELAEFDLSEYLARGRDITISRSIDGTPSELNFTVASGHLFDWTNSFSLLSPYLAKGRKLKIRFGEKIGGIDYWQNQGTFIISQNRIAYQRKNYPEMQVIAKDRRIFWDQAHVLATEWYNTDPVSALTDFLHDELDIPLDEIDLPEFDTSVNIVHQWMDLPAKDILDQICDRFGYFLRVTIDNKISAHKISDANPTDRSMTTLEEIVNYSPDDSFSDFVNQVTVVGYEQTEIEVLFNEERIASRNGTVGWWGFKKDYQIYYGEDQSRRCRYPRLEVLESTTSIAFELSGKIHESITEVDSNETYCVVTVTAPNLVPILILAIPAWAAAHFIPDLVVSWGGGQTIPVGRIVESIWMFIIIMILSAIGNFQFEIWGRPVGKIKRTIQATADDLELQAKIGAVIGENYDEPLCSDIPQCAEVAEQILLIKKLQRRRANFIKAADLRDEEGDTIEFPHPVSGDAQKFFITDITRRMRIPELKSMEGEFVDEVQGWRL